MTLIRLTELSKKGEERHKFISADAIKEVEAAPDGEAGCTVRTDDGVFKVKESVADVFDKVNGDPVVQSGPQKIMRAQAEAVRRMNPTDKPSGLTLRAARAPIFGEPHPAAHAAEVMRAETGDLQANEEVETRPDELKALDAQRAVRLAYRETRAVQGPPLLREPLQAEHDSVALVTATQEARTRDLEAREQAERASRAPRRSRARVEKDRADGGGPEDAGEGKTEV